MIKLCGFAVSNYYNKVKLALMEKGVEFEEALVWGSRDPALLARSPVGKVPYLETEHGPIAESQVLVNYIEARFPAHPLVPADPYAAAKVHELVTVIELHLELVARELYAEAFFGGKVSDEVKARAKKLLAKGADALGRLAKFGPYVGGGEFTMADCAAITHLPLVSQASKIIFGDDALAGLPLKAYLEQMGQRATVQKVNADRKANLAEFNAHIRG